MSEKNKTVDYEKAYKRFVKYQSDLHEHNQKRIKKGLKINLILPQLFLVLCFVTNSSKLLFLILWIVSLFGIAFYLIYVEYKDHQMQKLLYEIGSGDFDSLIGAPATFVENRVNSRMDALDDRVDGVRQTTRKKLSKVSDDAANTEQKADVAQDADTKKVTDNKQEDNDA